MSISARSTVRWMVECPLPVMSTMPLHYFTTLPTKVNSLTTGLVWDMMEL